MTWISTAQDQDSSHHPAIWAIMMQHHLSPAKGTLTAQHQDHHPLSVMSTIRARQQGHNTHPATLIHPPTLARHLLLESWASATPTTTSRMPTRASDLSNRLHVGLSLLLSGSMLLRSRPQGTRSKGVVEMAGFGLSAWGFWIACSVCMGQRDGALGYLLQRCLIEFVVDCFFVY